MAQDPGALVWIDLEMTGLDPERDRIIEIAVVVTNSQLEAVAEGPVIAVHQGEETLAGMDAWNQQTHGRSGLTQRVRTSPTDERAAELSVLDFLREHVAARVSPMCGNSVCQDRRFLARYMPELEAYFHYRNLDVSTVKELVRRWRPDLAKGVVKKGAHQALADIQESIEELRYYRSCFLRA